MKTIQQHPIHAAGILFGALAALMTPVTFVQRTGIFIIVAAVSNLLQLGYSHCSDKQPLTHKSYSDGFADYCLRLGVLILGLVCYSAPWQRKEIIDLRILSSILALLLMTISILVDVLPKRESASQDTSKND